MQKILEEFYHGNINPNEGTFPPDPNYKKAGKEVCRLEELLLSKLNEEEKALFESFQLAFLERSVIDDTQIFVDAFKLGARIMLDVMAED